MRVVVHAATIDQSSKPAHEGTALWGLLGTVSARLKTLHDVRLVKRRREAKHIYYSLSDTHVLRLVESAIEHAAESQ
jgi:hypothetical protein